MLLSTQAAAEGLNLQFCSDCLIMERQWNPSTEEQAEARFTRPGSTADRVNAHYLIAAGTIDDFFTELVEIKRRNVAQTLDGQEFEWDEKSLMAELGRVAMEKGLRKWKLK
jgi:SNF2 family DNA or RNA helicase